MTEDDVMRLATARGFHLYGIEIEGYMMGYYIPQTREDHPEDMVFTTLSEVVTWLRINGRKPFQRQPIRWDKFGF